MVCKSASFLFSIALILFFLMPNMLHSAQRRQDRSLLLHNAIKSQKSSIRVITELVASGWNISIFSVGVCVTETASLVMGA